MIPVLVLAFIHVFSGENEMIRINFQVHAPNLNDSAAVFITGDHPNLGGWDPDLVKMTNRGSGKWDVTIAVEKEHPLEFKFTRGTWDTEALLENGQVPSNFRLTAKSDTSLAYTILRWKDDCGSPALGQITGTVRYHRNVEGRDLKPRDLIVWLPPDYDQKKKQRYPVFYMQDGRNLFDPGTSFAGMDWQMDEIADSLIRRGEIQPIIIVGIDNTPDRTKEYSTGPLGDAYIRFVIDSVKPFIDENYRTKPDAQNTAVGGSSAGGLISFRLAWEHPDVFSKVACFSSALKIEKIDYITPVREYNGKKKKIKLYLDCGGAGLEARLKPGVDEMALTLKEKGFILNKDLFILYNPVASHNETAWSKRIGPVLKLFFGK
jgi:predicted alpha/beta superfamily hydrolase